MDPVKNFAYGIILTPPTPATTGTSFVLTAGQGTNFPDPSVGGNFNVIIWPVGALPTNQNAEIVRVSANANDTFTVTRTQEGSNARQILQGDQVALVPTAKTMTDIQALITANTAAINAVPSFPLSVLNGGTGATTASQARANLGLVIGLNVQSESANLDTWATKTPPAGIPVGTTDTQAITHKDLTDATNSFPSLISFATSGPQADTNTNSATFVDVAGATVTINPTKTVTVHVVISANFYDVTGISNDCTFALLIDGVVVQQYPLRPSTANFRTPLTLSGQASVASGARIIKMQYKVTGGDVLHVDQANINVIYG